MNRWTVIVSGGMLEEEFARSVLENPEIEFIIGVDRGLEFLYRHEICPNYIVGDFDSVSGEILGYYEKETKVPIRKFNPVKDASDTEIALVSGFGKKEHPDPGSDRKSDRSYMGKCTMFKNRTGCRSRCADRGQS